MSGIGLEWLVEEDSTVDRIRKSIAGEKTPFEGIYGIKDVKESLMNTLEQASFISRQGYTPIILLIGPSGSGKTELINSVVRSYKRYSRDNKMFTIKINGAKCPYNENPYNIYRSILPFDITEKFADKVMNSKRPELCYRCEHNLEQMLGGDNKIEVERIFPQSSTVEFGDNFLLPSFINVVRNSNRSILTISADKSRLEKINPKIFQLLNNIYDNNFSDATGNRVPLDSLIIMHSNEMFMEISEEEKRESRPLLERIIRVDVRRNLSYSEEVKLSMELNIPVKKIVPNFLEYIAKLNVLSRISPDDINGSDNDDINNILELLDYYDSSRLKEFEMNMTQSTSNFLGRLLPDYSSYVFEGDKKDNGYLRDAARSIIFDSGNYKSGWTTGISSRSISSVLDFNYMSNKSKDYLSFSDIAGYLNKNMEKIDEQSYEEIQGYIDSLITNRVRSDIEYSVLSFYFGGHFKDYSEAISAYVNSLITVNQSQKFKDTNGYLSEAGRYFDVEGLKDEINSFKEKTVPLGIVNFSAKFDKILDFLVSTQNDFVKKENKFKNFVGEYGKDIDRTSELYPYIRNFLKNNFGYFDEAVEEAFKIYKEGTLFYDQ